MMKEISKAEAKRRLNDSDKVYYVIFNSKDVESGVARKSERKIEKVQTNALISNEVINGEKKSIYFYFKNIERVTESFIEYTTLLDNLCRFYFERAKEEWEVL